VNFQYYDLKQQPRGAIVAVTIKGNAPNVRLLDDSNFRNYRNGQAYRGYGGVPRSSPTRIPIPHSGHWHLVIDFQGLRGSARVGVNVEPPPMTQLRSTNVGSLSQIRHEAPAEARQGMDQQVWDVFISHASEDKAPVARPLTEALQARGISVWLDDFELKIGDSLRRKIDVGLANSAFGVVVLSRNFFAKGWPQYELDGLVTRQVSGEQTLLPVWHEITKDEVVAHSPSLADKIARSTAQFTIEEIAQEIAEVVRPDLIAET
jgi:Domain of unknown function (DUF1883)/TIR domain